MNSIMIKIKMVVIRLEQKCEVCLRVFTWKAVTHVAGFPEREYTFCSDKCRDLFLRMEDDELEYFRHSCPTDEDRKE